MDVYINYVKNLSENDLLEGKRYHVEADKLKILAEDYKHFFIKPRAALIIFFIKQNQVKEPYIEKLEKVMIY